MALHMGFTGVNKNPTYRKIQDDILWEQKSKSPYGSSHPLRSIELNNWNNIQEWKSQWIKNDIQEWKKECPHWNHFFQLFFRAGNFGRLRILSEPCQRLGMTSHLEGFFLGEESGSFKKKGKENMGNELTR